jgi:hypothetical protein
MAGKRKRQQQIVTFFIGLIFIFVLIGLGMVMMTITPSLSNGTEQPTAYYEAPPTSATATP